MHFHAVRIHGFLEDEFAQGLALPGPDGPDRVIGGTEINRVVGTHLVELRRIPGHQSGL